MKVVLGVVTVLELLVLGTVKLGVVENVLGIVEDFVFCFLVLGFDEVGIAFDEIEAVFAVTGTALDTVETGFDTVETGFDIVDTGALATFGRATRGKVLNHGFGGDILVCLVTVVFNEAESEGCTAESAFEAFTLGWITGMPTRVAIGLIIGTPTGVAIRWITELTGASARWFFELADKLEEFEEFVTGRVTRLQGTSAGRTIGLTAPPVLIGIDFTELKDNMSPLLDRGLSRLEEVFEKRLSNSNGFPLILGTALKGLFGDGDF